MVYLFSSLPGLICHWFNQSSEPINSSEKPPLPSALGVIFSSFHFSFKCLPHLEILKNNLPQYSSFMCTRRECRPWPLGNHWWPILGPNWGFTGSLFYRFYLKTATLLWRLHLVDWIIHSFIHWFIHSIHPTCTHPTFILPYAKL